MADGTSWNVQPDSPSGRRIRVALERGDVRWTRRTSEWLDRHFDRNVFNQREVARMLRAFVERGGEIRGQRNASGYDHEVWFCVEIELKHVKRFIKFVIEPDDEDDPGLLIVSAHPPH